MQFKPIQRVDYIVVHCSATKPTADIGAKDIDAWHRERGFLKIGYHWVIRRDGTLEVGRHDTQPGAHAAGYNQISLGICLAGGVAADGRTPEDNYTPAQMAVLAEVVSKLKRNYPKAEVLGHRDLPGVRKACPSFDVREWFAGITV